MIMNKSRTYAKVTFQQLNAMATADFEKYKALVFADPEVLCNTGDAPTWNAPSTAAPYGPESCGTTWL
jgi:hypothetical protein